jgi:hypothetical protein
MDSFFSGALIFIGFAVASLFIDPNEENHLVPDVEVQYVLHRKKRFTSFPSPAGMSLTKLPLGRNNSVMTSLFPPRESLVVTSRLGTGNSRTFFYGVRSVGIGLDMLDLVQIGWEWLRYA